MAAALAMLAPVPDRSGSGMDNGQDAAWLPLSQAGQRLGLSRGALRKRIARGRLGPDGERRAARDLGA